ncbi:hypothetical protein BJ875DRAFT_374471, partial [Amylocarpus encephaloides]
VADAMAGETLPDRKNEIVAAMITITTVATFFTFWRLYVRYKLNPKFGWKGLSDYLIAAAVLFHIATNVLSVTSAFYGNGKLDRDPDLTPARKRVCNKLLFISSVCNITTMFLIRLSVASYLVNLYFSRGYKTLVWITVAIVIICNFLLPSVNFYAYCRPIAMRWDPRVKGKCLTTRIRLMSAYAQASANIVTDLVYTASPIVYLMQVKLPKRTQWGVRVVFLFALSGTILSIIKLFWLYRILQLKRDYLYEGVSLTLISGLEVGVGMITANLPPLRKTFEGILGRVLPASMLSSTSRGTPSDGMGHACNSTVKRSRMDETARSDDGESEVGILEDYGKKGPGIWKTTRVTIENYEDAEGIQPHGARTRM